MEIGENDWSKPTQVLESEGPFKFFQRLYLDGHELRVGMSVQDVLTGAADYFAEEGSTKITIRTQTLANQGVGTHTIAAEFRDGAGKLHVATQNYTIKQTTVSNNAADDYDYDYDYEDVTPVKTAPAKEATDNADNENNANHADDAATPNAFQFSDVPADAWYYEDAKWTFENGYMVGVSDDRFAPEESITQSIIVTVLARMGEIDLTRFDGAASDSVTPDQWYTTAAIWAEQAGMLPDSSSFAETGSSSRGEMAVMLVKYLRSLGVDTALPQQTVTFEDGEQMTQEENEAFQVLYKYGVFKGVGGGNMNASGTTSRCEFAALIHRLSAFAQEQS
jgi:hypothetical protein